MDACDGRVVTEDQVRPAGASAIARTARAGAAAGLLALRLLEVLVRGALRGGHGGERLHLLLHAQGVALRSGVLFAFAHGPRAYSGRFTRHEPLAPAAGTLGQQCAADGDLAPNDEEEGTE